MRIVFAFALFFSTFATAGVLPSKQDEALALNSQGLRQLERGRANAAARLFARAEEAACAQYGSRSLPTAMILRNWAYALLRLDEPEEAMQLGTRALQIVEQAAGEQDPHLTPVLNTLAEIAIASHRYDEASTLLRRAQAIGPQAGGHYSTALRNLAAVDALRGRVTAASSGQ